MKNGISILICCLVSLSFSYGQGGKLLLTNTSSKKEHIIEAGQNISVYISESSFVKGELVLIDSASISIGKDTIPLSKIYTIKAKSTQTKNKGGIVTGIGGVFILGGVVAMASAAEQKDSSFDITSGVYEATGVGLFAIGGIMTSAGIIILTKGKSYKSDEWEYSVR